MQGFLEQVRRNAVALISLVIAITSLSYNTWRNEKTEHNRNVRHAAFEMLLKAGELEQVVFRQHFGGDSLGQGGEFAGWAVVLTLRDLAMVMPGEVEASTDALFDTWQAHFEALGTSDASQTAVSDALDDLRASLLTALNRLD